MQAYSAAFSPCPLSRKTAKPNSPETAVRLRICSKTAFGWNPALALTSQSKGTD